MTGSIVRNALMLTMAAPVIDKIARETAEREASDARLAAALSNLHGAFNG